MPMVAAFCFTVSLVVTVATDGDLNGPAQPKVGAQHHRTELDDTVVLAQCEAQCYVDPKHSVGVVTNVYENNFTMYECIRPECQQCVNVTVRKITAFDDCIRFCGNHQSCRESCSCVYGLLSQGVGQSSALAAPLPPTMACQDVVGWSPSSPSSLEFETVVANGMEMWSDEKIGPTVFVVEVRRNSTSGDVSEWELLGKSKMPFLDVPGLMAASFYQFRTRSVAPDGILATSAVSDWLRTLPANASLKPPTELVYLGTQAEGRELVATFIWTPPIEKFCFYQLFWFHSDVHEIHSKFIFMPIEQFEVRLRGLNFDANYTVQMMAISGDGMFESRKIETNFVTGSCLVTFGDNFTLCGPGSPRNLGYESTRSSSLASTDFVTLFWSAPIGTTGSNAVLYYEVKLTKLFGFQSPTPFVIPFAFEAQVPGNETHVTVDDVPRKGNYLASVTPISSGGRGKSAAMYFILAAATEVESRDSTAFLILAVSSCLLLAVVAIVCVLIYRTHQRRLAKTVRDRYFISLDQNQPADDLELASSKQDFMVGDPAFEVNFSTLLLGDVLGRGAFGLVRKAQMRSNKPWTLWENVAVKMLHPGYSDLDERYLLEEIEMMKCVGHHPHLVSLIAYCTKKPNVCLVVEHCSYGDLQSYLHIYRNKEVFGFRKTDSTVDELRRSLKDSGIAGHHSSIQENSLESFVSSCFYDESGNHVPSMSSNEPRSSEYSYYDSDLVNIDEDVKLTSNDLLSFARQVSMGMEYLSQNKLVHRDLAARNVLVYDRKLVKVSDFGLMRDVYESNVYRRKTNGKLPIKWMAYESIFDHVFTTKSDVWSFGILLYEIFTLGETPYPGISNMQLIGLLKEGYRMEKPANCGEILYTMMSSCWQNNPANRPSFTKLRHELESILESSLNYLTLDLGVDEENYYKFAARTRSEKTGFPNSRMVVDDPLTHFLGAYFIDFKNKLQLKLLYG